MIQVTSQQSNNDEIIKMDCHLKGKINPQVMKSENFFQWSKCPGMPIKNPVLANKFASKKSGKTFTLVTIIINIVVIISLFIIVE
jgi:hypothetical protein